MLIDIKLDNALDVPAIRKAMAEAERAIWDRVIDAIETDIATLTAEAGYQLGQIEMDRDLAILDIKQALDPARPMTLDLDGGSFPADGNTGGDSADHRQCQAPSP